MYVISSSRNQRPPNDTTQPTFQRRSLFGLFVRRCYLSYMKLSVMGAEILVNEYVSWRNGVTSAYEVYRGENVEAGIESTHLPSHLARLFSLGCSECTVQDG
jgi:hypothetical protein